MLSQNIDWQNGTNEAACQALTDCPAARFVSVAATRSTDRACAPCPEETWSVAVNAARCPAATVCRPGTYISANLTVTSDRECLPCVTGVNFTATANALACQPGEDTSASSTSSPRTATILGLLVGCGVAGMVLLLAIRHGRRRRQRTAAAKVMKQARFLVEAVVPMSPGLAVRSAWMDASGETPSPDRPPAPIIASLASPIYQVAVDRSSQAGLVPQDAGDAGWDSTAPDGSGAPLSPVIHVAAANAIYAIPQDLVTGSQDGGAQAGGPVWVQAADGRGWDQAMYDVSRERGTRTHAATPLTTDGRPWNLATYDLAWQTGSEPTYLAVFDANRDRTWAVPEYDVADRRASMQTSV